MMFTPVLLKKRTNRIGNTKTETQQPWVSVPTRNPVSVIHYYYQVFNSTCCQRKRKRQYTKTLLLIYYYYGKKEIKRQNCCGNFFSPKNQKIKSKTRLRICEILSLARLLISRDFWSRYQNFNCHKIHEQGSYQNPPSLNGGNLLKLQTLIFSDPMFLPLLLSQPKKTNKNE